jgi:hypothetical protein
MVASGFVLLAGSLWGAVGPAGATPVPPAAGSCAYTDGTQVTGSVLTGVNPGDVISVTCTGLPTNVDGSGSPVATPSTMSEASPLASTVSPSNLAPDETDTSAATTGTIDTAGTLTQVFTVPAGTGGTSGFVATDPNATCPPTQAQVDDGLVACTLNVSNSSTGAILDQVVLVYAGQPTPAPPTLVVAPSAGAVGDTMTVTDAPSATGYWWGGGGKPATIPASAILLGTATPTSSSVSVSAPSYAVPLDASNNPEWTLAILFPPKLSGSFELPSGLTTGTVPISMFETDQLPAPFTGNSTNASFPNDLSASSSFTAIDTSQATMSAQPTSGGAGTAVVLSGANWDPQGGPMTVEFSQTGGLPFNEIGTDKLTSVSVQANGAFSAVFVVGVSETNGLTGPDTAYVVATQTAIGGGVLSASTPFTLEPGCEVPAGQTTCSTLMTLSVQVQGSVLGITEVQTGTNPSATQVMFPATILDGLDQIANGTLNSVQVFDNRGTLSGWSVTGQLQSDFTNTPMVGTNIADNTIPANELVWTPSVSLVGPDSGNLADVRVGATAALNNTSGPAQTLCSAPSGGGGGSYTCGASLALTIPAYVAAGTYSAVLTVLLTGT